MKKEKEFKIDEELQEIRDTIDYLENYTKKLIKLFGNIKLKRI